MSSCSVAISRSPVFSPSSSSSSICSPNSSSPRLIRLQKSSGLIKALAGGSAGDSSAILKRKRPPRLNIPVFSVEEKEAAAASEDVMEVEGDEYSVCCKRGRRDEMEDRYSIMVGLQGDSKQALFGIFDGHGGAKAAEFAAENLDKNIIQELNKRQDNDDEVEVAVRSGYLTTDSEFLKRDVRGGTCCVTALIVKGNLVVSNAGDCRAVASRGGVAEALTSDHRPSREDERERIENLGGFVQCRNGVWRVLGSLAVSRGIGDQYLKQWVTAEPETKVVKLDQEYEFLVLASDGLWDKVSNQEAIDIARLSCMNVEKARPLSACRKLVDLSVSRGSTDDISVMVVQLGRFLNN